MCRGNRAAKLIHEFSYKWISEQWNQNTARAASTHTHTHTQDKTTHNTHTEQLAACCGVKDGLNVWGALSGMGNDDPSRGA